MAGRGIICIKIGDQSDIMKHGDIADVLLTSEHQNLSVDEILSDNMLKVYGIIETTEERAREIRAFIRPDYPETFIDKPETLLFDPPKNKYRFDIKKFVDDGTDPDLENKWLSKDPVPKVVDEILASKYLLPNTDASRAPIIDNNAIYDGWYSVGTAKDYASLLLFKNDIGATGLGGDMTGHIETDTTNTATVYFHETELNGHTLHIHNDASHAGNFMNRNNLYVLDQTGGAFHGIYFRQDQSSSDGSFVVSHQHFKNINGKCPSGSQTADFIATTGGSRGYNMVFHDNLHESPWEPDSSSWYAFWFAGDAINFYEYNNIIYGYRQTVPWQDSSQAYIENSTYIGSSASGPAYFITPRHTFKNCYSWNGGNDWNSISDQTGYNNASADLTADDFDLEVDNQISVVAADEFYSTDYEDGELFLLPKPSSKLIHKGINVSIPNHSEYINDLSIIEDRVHVGAKGIYVKPYGMYFNQYNQDKLSTVSSFSKPSNVTVTFWVCLMDLVESRILGYDNLWEIGLFSQGKVYNDLNQGATRFVSDGAISDYTLSHVVCTAASDSTGQIYINGVLDKQAAYQSGSPAASGTLDVGYSSWGPDALYMHGYLQDVRIYNRILTANECKTIYESHGSDSIVHGLMNRWLLNDGQEYTAPSGAGSVKDYGPDQLHLTPSNEPFYMGTTLKTGRKYQR